RRSTNSVRTIASQTLKQILSVLTFVLIKKNMAVTLIVSEPWNVGTVSAGGSRRLIQTRGVLGMRMEKASKAALASAGSTPKDKGEGLPHTNRGRRIHKLMKEVTITSEHLALIDFEVVQLLRGRRGSGFRRLD